MCFTSIILPSEAARLVLGYLREVGCVKSYETLLQEHADLEECRRYQNCSRSLPLKIHGYTLLQIIDEFCSFKSNQTRTEGITGQLLSQNASSQTQPSDSSMECNPSVSVPSLQTAITQLQSLFLEENLKSLTCMSELNDTLYNTLNTFKNDIRACFCSQLAETTVSVNVVRDSLIDLRSDCTTKLTALSNGITGLSDVCQGLNVTTKELSTNMDFKVESLSKSLSNISETVSQEFDSQSHVRPGHIDSDLLSKFNELETKLRLIIDDIEQFRSLIDRLETLQTKLSSVDPACASEFATLFDRLSENLISRLNYQIRPDRPESESSYSPHRINESSHTACSVTQYTERQRARVRRFTRLHRNKSPTRIKGVVPISPPTSTRVSQSAKSASQTPVGISSSTLLSPRKYTIGLELERLARHMANDNELTQRFAAIINNVVKEKSDKADAEDIMNDSKQQPVAASDDKSDEQTLDSLKKANKSLVVHDDTTKLDSLLSDDAIEDILTRVECDEKMSAAVDSAYCLIESFEPPVTSSLSDPVHKEPLEGTGSDRGLAEEPKAPNQTMKPGITITPVSLTPSLSCAQPQCSFSFVHPTPTITYPYPHSIIQAESVIAEQASACDTGNSISSYHSSMETEAQLSSSCRFAQASFDAAQAQADNLLTSPLNDTCIPLISPSKHYRLAASDPVSDISTHETISSNCLEPIMVSETTCMPVAPVLANNDYNGSVFYPFGVSYPPNSECKLNASTSKTASQLVAEQVLLKRSLDKQHAHSTRLGDLHGSTANSKNQEKARITSTSDAVEPTAVEIELHTPIPNSIEDVFRRRLALDFNRELTSWEKLEQVVEAEARADEFSRTLDKLSSSPAKKKTKLNQRNSEPIVSKRPKRKATLSQSATKIQPDEVTDSSEYLKPLPPNSENAHESFPAKSLASCMANNSPHNTLFADCQSLESLETLLTVTGDASMEDTRAAEALVALSTTATPNKTGSDKKRCEPCEARLDCPSISTTSADSLNARSSPPDTCAPQALTSRSRRKLSKNKQITTPEKANADEKKLEVRRVEATCLNSVTPVSSTNTNTASVVSESKTKESSDRPAKHKRTVTHPKRPAKQQRNRSKSVQAIDTFLNQLYS